MTKETIHVHLIPGLGVDERLFQRLQFPEGVQPHYWNWEEPKPTESLVEYAHRYLHKINAEQPVILLGVSFGGIMAQEIAKLVEVDKIILISSIKHADELPWYFALGRTLPVHSWVSGQQIKSIGARVQRALGDNGKGAELFESMLTGTPDRFMPWAIEQLIHWKQDFTPANVVHYHGTNDHVFPSKYLTNFTPIVNGTHAMIMVEAAKMNEILSKELDEMKNKGR